MPIYVVVNNADGTRQRVANVPLEPAHDQHLVVFSSLDEEPSEATHTWDAALEIYVERPEVFPPPISRTRLTRREFLQRLDAVGALDAANVRIITPPTTPQEIELVAALVKFKDYVMASDFIELTLQKTQDGMGLLMLVGYCTPEEGAQVLAPSTVESE